jgi:PAT family beta-lactamase induction signal transducer AmpG
LTHKEFQLSLEKMTTQKKLFWVAVLYFAEGFPLGMVYDFLPVYFRQHSISLKEIGLLSLLGLPWTLKFLWAPAIDLWGQRRHWMVTCQVGLALVLVTIPLFGLTQIHLVLWFLLLCIPVLSATQDIAIDAYTIELMEKEEMGRANGVRVTAYRIALMTMGGLLAVAGWMGWTTAFVMGAVCLIIASVICSRASDSMTGRIKIQSTQNIKVRMIEVTWGAFQKFLSRPGFLFVMLFILLFKLGDMAMGPMIKPFWVDRSFTAAQIGMVSVTFGVAMTTLGALLGGFLTDRWGIFHALWILGLAQAFSNLLYAVAASLPTSVPLIYTASIVESFTGGLGTGPFLAFLMSICDKQHAATQYALLSALFGLTRVVSGTFSGFAAEQFGYASYFAITFFLSFPAFALLPWVKQWTKAGS